jgi:hypothetical protein
VLDLCQDLGLKIRAEDGNLVVSPADKLPATLRDQLREQKEALVDLLCPQSFDNPRGKLRQLEKALHTHVGEPEVDLIIILHRGHQHDEQELQEMERRVRQAALARWRDTGEEPGVVPLHVGRARSLSGCAVCRALLEAATPGPPTHA